MRRIAIVVVLLVAAGGCSGASEFPPHATPPSAGGSPSPISSEPAKRSASGKRPEVVNDASAGSRGLVRQAIADLKRAGIWRKVLPDVDRISIRSREGDARVPDDRHLAEAVRLPYLLDGEVTVDCQIVFFPVAIQRDLEVQATAYAEGYLDSQAPSLRQFWGAILGHELAHCLRWRGGEPFAERWEERSLAALREAGIP